MPSYGDAFALLKDYELSAKQYVGTQETRIIAEAAFAGIAFLHIGYLFVFSVTNVREIIPLPPITRLPQVAPWLKGIVSHRGELISVMDFDKYLGQAPIELTAEKRLIILQHQEMTAGMLVGDLLGSIRFSQEAKRVDVDIATMPFAEYVREIWQEGKKNWHVFDVDALFESPQFYQISL